LRASDDLGFTSRKPKKRGQFHFVPVMARAMLHRLGCDLRWRFDDNARFAFQVAFLGRMIFSCLVDADFKDTEQFYARIEEREVDRDWPTLQSILPGLIGAFDRPMGEMRNTETTIKGMRLASSH
jgi:hypothetical protein